MHRFKSNPNSQDSKRALNGGKATQIVVSMKNNFERKAQENYFKLELTKKICNHGKALPSTPQILFVRGFWMWTGWLQSDSKALRKLWQDDEGELNFKYKHQVKIFPVKLRDVQKKTCLLFGRQSILFFHDALAACAIDSLFNPVEYPLSTEVQFFTLKQFGWIA